MTKSEAGTNCIAVPYSKFWRELVHLVIYAHGSNSCPVVSPAVGHWGTCSPSTLNIFTSLRSKYDSQQSKHCVVCEILPFPPIDNVWAMMNVWRVEWSWWDSSLILYILFAFSVLMLLVGLLVPYVLTSTSISHCVAIERLRVAYSLYTKTIFCLGQPCVNLFSQLCTTT